MKKVLGYIYKTGSESMIAALTHYGVDVDGLHRNLEETKKCFEHDKKQAFIGKTTKAKFYRVVVEEVEE